MQTVGQQIGSFHSHAGRRIKPLISKLGHWNGLLTCTTERLAGRARILHISAEWIHDMIAPIAIIVGAIAFGLWWNSIAAALFGCFVLFFLAGIYKAIEQLAGTRNIMRRDGPSTVDLESRALTVPAQKTDIQLKAIQRLRPWVDNETSLTEEGAKAYCNVLLDLVAASDS
jgi:hypothetical protein